MNRHYNIGLKLSALLLVVVMTGCSRKSNSFTSRVYHQMVSKFNPLFNGEEALKAGVLTLETSHVDDFDRILDVYRWGDEEKASNIRPDMERAIEKGSKVIQRHSMMISNRQKNKFIDNSYLLIGKARFFKREYQEALEVFNYVIQEFPKQEAYYIAKLWAARCKTEMENFLGAKADFDEIYRSKKLPKELKDDVFASYAQLQIDQHNETAAYQLLSQALENTRRKKDKVRWLFIMGQLQAHLENHYEASELFLKVIKKGPPYEFLFQAQLNRARYYDVEIEDPRKVFSELRAMLRDDKNYDNRDQIYYVMAEIAEKLEEDAKVEEFLKKSIRVSTTNALQKALSYLKLAEINFANRLYPTSQAYYDSTFSNMAQDHPRYAEVKRFKESLGELVKNLNIIEDQDSLLALSTLSEAELNVRIDVHIERLKEIEKEKQREEEALASGNNLNNLTRAGLSGPSTPGATGQWYFYNQSLRSVGLRDFKNLFGNRPLEDNWRRKNKQVIAEFDEGLPEDEEGDLTADAGEEGEDGSKSGDKYDRENFKKDIPFDQEAKDKAHQKIKKAYVAVGEIYRDKLDDYESATTSLEKLLKRYPDYLQKSRVWYALYRMFTTLENESKAKHYRDLILSQYPDSEYATLINNEGKEDVVVEETVLRRMYKRAYGHFKDSKYRRSGTVADSALALKDTSDIMPRFMLLKAFCVGHLKSKDDYIKALKLVTASFPTSEQAGEAQNILNLLTGGGEPAVAEESSAPKPTYSTQKASQYKYVVVVPNKGKVNKARIAISDFSKNFFANDKLRTKSVILNQDDQIIIVNSFPDTKKGMTFYDNILKQKVLVPYLAGGKFRHFVISNDNFKKFFKDKDTDGYLEFFEKNYLKGS